jgi:hypothetical protein
MLGETSTLRQAFHAGSLTHKWTESVCCSVIAYGFKVFEAFEELNHHGGCCCHCCCCSRPRRRGR